jgi:hypothetical protein
MPWDFFCFVVDTKPGQDFLCWSLLPWVKMQFFSC